MVNYLNRLNKDDVQNVRRIGQLADRHNVHAYVVGGLVRDLILRCDNDDLDIVIEGDAIKFARVVAFQLKGKLTVHSPFKTAVLILSNGRRIDFASSRKESYPHRGALPVVSAGSLKEDLLRRDFTINALALKINTKDFGTLEDVCGGLRDLNKKVVRTLHPNSFVDDPTRILRAIRFEQRLGFALERQTLKALKSALLLKQEKNVKPPRYFNEFRKVLQEKLFVKCVRRIHVVHGFNFLSNSFKPNMSVLKLIDQGMRKHQFPNQQVIVNLMFLLESLALSERKELAKQLHLTKMEQENVMWVDQRANFYPTLKRKTCLRSEIYWLLKSLNDHQVSYLFLRTKNDLIQTRIMNYISKDSKIGLLMTGDDLKKLGVPQGKKSGEILRAVLSMKIDRNLKTKSQELNAAKNIF